MKQSLQNQQQKLIKEKRFFKRQIIEQIKNAKEANLLIGTLQEQTTDYIQGVQKQYRNKQEEMLVELVQHTKIDKVQEISQSKPQHEFEEQQKIIDYLQQLGCSVGEMLTKTLNEDLNSWSQKQFYAPRHENKQ